MKYFIYTILGLVSFSQIAVAADKTDGASSGIAVERILCAKAAAPASDVAYKPGVDVNGNSVVPADGGSATIPLQAHYTEVPLNVNLARRLNLPQVSEAQMTVASIRIYDDGRVLYNGQDIKEQTIALCGGKTPPAIQPSMQAPKTVTMPASPEIPLPGSAAPSSTTPAR